MKIGILTQPLHSNYGGLLQNYALQQILKKLGHEPETIDWSMPNTLRHRLSFLKSKIISLVNKTNRVNYRLSKQEKSIIEQNTSYFISKYIKHTPALLSRKAFRRQSDIGKYDAYVVGSDQCWRPAYNYFIYEMFLSFVENRSVRKVAYAASFGTDNWEFNEKQSLNCSCLAKKFDSISVREDSGIRLCNDFLGVDAIHVLDPTMLLSKDDYVALVQSEKESVSKGSLFYYVLDPSSDKLSFIQKIAKDIGLVPFSVMPKYQSENRTKSAVKKDIENCIFPSVTSWLRAFMDAEMTIVDSFHGMVFSIIFNKPFWVIGNTGRGMSRFLSLLKLLKLENRLIEINDIDSINFTEKIDWNCVNTKLNHFKAISLSFLECSLERDCK